MLSQGAKWYNENIYYRKAQMGIMKTFIIARRKMAINMWPLRGQDTKINRPQRGRKFLAFYYRKAQMVQWKHLSSQGANVTMKTLIIARHKMLQWKHLLSQGTNSTMKTLIIARHKMAINMWPLRGQDKNKPTPEGSHIYKRGYLFR